MSVPDICVRSNYDLFQSSAADVVVGQGGRVGGRQGMDELFWQIKKSLNNLPHFYDDKLEAEKKNEREKHNKKTREKKERKKLKRKKKKKKKTR